MDLNYSAEELAFRDEVRGWLQQNLPGDLRDKVANYDHLSKDDLLRWHRILAKQGWVAPAWPKEWGGTGWNVVQRYLFEEELGYVGSPPLIPFGLTMCAPVLLQFGTEAQKKRFLPRIYNGDDFWCQGYSEPGSGSDLASLKTKAVREGDHYVVNGQKIWTTLGHYADWIFCLVRTDPTVEKRQEGISFLLIDMKTPGITVRPLILMDGAHEVNEVFFDDVRVPAENLVFKEGKGWTVAKYLLGYERMNTGRIGASKRELAKLKEFASRKTNDFRFRDRLTRLEVALRREAGRYPLPRPPVAARGGAHRARDHQPALPRPHAPHRPAAGRGRVDAQDQGHRDPAGPHRAHDAGRGPGRRARTRREARATLLQHAQDDDLRRLERDPAQHHRQDDARPIEKKGGTRP
jgi:alkylation response protein AidB-like acyl-CoA dehydrogenase